MAGHVHTGSAAVLLVGLSFRSAPVSLLEQVSMVDTDLPKLENALLDHDSLSEALVLSTCNRMEFYTVANAFHPGLGRYSGACDSCDFWGGRVFRKV